MFEDSDNIRDDDCGFDGLSEDYKEDGDREKILAHLESWARGAVVAGVRLKRP
jgi:hypothetical protein